MVGDGGGGQGVAPAVHHQPASGPVAERASNGYGPNLTAVERQRAGIVQVRAHIRRVARARQGYAARPIVVKIPGDVKRYTGAACSETGGAVTGHEVHRATDVQSALAPVVHDRDVV